LGEVGLLSTLMLAAVLGLFGFIEPCSIGSSKVMDKQPEQKPARRCLDWQPALSDRIPGWTGAALAG
jgi:hypothetical protein